MFSLITDEAYATYKEATKETGRIYIHCVEMFNDKDLVFFQVINNPNEDIVEPRVFQASNNITIVSRVNPSCAYPYLYVQGTSVKRDRDVIHCSIKQYYAYANAIAEYNSQIGNLVITKTVENLTEYMNNQLTNIRNCIAIFKSDMTPESFMLAKQELTITLIDSIPLSRNTCYYCMKKDTANQTARNTLPLGCNDCSYGNAKGICTSANSKYDKIKTLIDNLVAELSDYAPV